MSFEKLRGSKATYWNAPVDRLYFLAALSFRSFTCKPPRSREYRRWKLPEKNGFGRRGRSQSGMRLDRSGGEKNGTMRIAYRVGLENLTFTEAQPRGRIRLAGQAPQCQHPLISPDRWLQRSDKNSFFQICRDGILYSISPPFHSFLPSHFLYLQQSVVCSILFPGRPTNAVFT